MVRTALVITTLYILGGCEPFTTTSQQISYTAEDSLRSQISNLMNLPKTRAPGIDFAKTYLSESDQFTLFKIVLYPLSGDSIPAFFLEPKKVDPPYPLMICLQGHAPGMYISIGEARSENDKLLIAGGRDIALQAVKHGWAALTIEQRGFGEQEVPGISCNHLSLNGALQGRPMLGQRVLDISHAIDFVQQQEDIPVSTIACMGNSAGGTTSYFAAAMDPRIELAVVSCSFSTYEKSWLKYPHCACGYLPGLLKWADMPDVAKLIAPRDLLIIAGKQDYLADIDGVRDGFNTAQSFYGPQNALDHLVLAEGDGGHQFYPELAWKYIDHYKLHGSLK